MMVAGHSNLMGRTFKLYGGIFKLYGGIFELRREIPPNKYVLV